MLGSRRPTRWRRAAGPGCAMVIACDVAEASQPNHNLNASSPQRPHAQKVRREEAIGLSQAEPGRRPASPMATQCSRKR